MTMGKLTDHIVLEKKRFKKLPLYQQIREQIQQNIISKEIAPGAPLPSIAYLAKKWNVTYRTIKAAYDLLEKDGIINYRTNKSVEIASNHAVVSERATKKFSLVYIACHHDDPYYAIAYEGIRSFAVENNAELMLISVGSSHKRFIDAVLNPGEGTDGMIILPFETPDFKDAVKSALEFGKRLVFLDRFLPDVEASSVEADHYSVAYQATTHLISLHNKPVYYLAFVNNPSGARDWFKGWCSAMNNYGYFDLQPYVFDFPVAEERLADTVDLGLEYSIEAAIKLFESRKEEEYCIFSGNDFIARGVYIAAEKMGLRIGRDVFIVGSGNMPFDDRLPVPLSSVRTVPSTQELGYQAAKLLYEHLMGTAKHPARRLLPVELIARESSTGVKASVNAENEH
jgi:DNA-binding LacI/PurR family transcriptional regulator